MKKLLLVLGLAATSAIGFGQTTSYTIGSGFTAGIFFPINATIQISDSTIIIEGDVNVFEYDIVPSTNSTNSNIYYTDGIITGKIVIQNHVGKKKIKGFTPNYQITQIMNINSPTVYMTYYAVLD